MFLKSMWLPVIAGVVLLVGCESKPADTIPQTAPAAAKEPFEILPHLKYIAVKKDFNDVKVIAPDDLNGLYGNAWWFHNHAGQMDVNLSADEIKGLGAEEVRNLGYIAPDVSMTSLQMAMDKLSAKQIPALPDNMQGIDLEKLDKLPKSGKDFEALNGPLLRATYDAGIYRLLKGVPASMWNEVSVLKTQPTKSPNEAQVILGYQGTAIIETTVRQKADKSYGIIYIHYLVHPRALAKSAQAGAKQ